MNKHSPEFIADMLIHLGRSASQISAGPVLTEAQWSALRFFAHANRFSRRPSAFASFHGTTRGTASQTVKSLVKLGYLRGRKARSDGRSMEFELTQKGRTLMQDDPAIRLVDAIKALPEAARCHLDDTIRLLNQQLDGCRSSDSFGSCRDCQLYTPGPDKGSGRCCYANSPVSPQETWDLCVQYRPV